MLSKRERRDTGLATLVFLGSLVVAGVAIFSLFGCQTYEAVVAAPEEFWMTAEAIVAALVMDIWSVLELLL